MIQKVKAALRSADSAFAKIGSSIVRVVQSSRGREPRPSGRARRLYIDATYIYSTNINTGIQRVVRNIIKNLETHTEKRSIELVTAALVNGAIIKIDKGELETFRDRSKINNLFQRIIRKLKLYFISFFAGELPYENDILFMLDSSWHLHVWPSVAYAKERGAKIVGITYDLIPVTHSHFCDDVMEYYFTQWYKESLKYFDGYICISKTVMHNLEDYFKKQGIGVQEYTFDSFTLGADFDKNYSGSKEIRETLIELYRSRSSVYLTVSTIEPRKNHRLVYEALKLLWANGLDITWIIVGRMGWKTEILQQEMQKDEAYQDKLWIYNDLSDLELHYCYQHSKALIFPSIVEGYGLPIIESLKNGLPVVASDTPIHREVGGDKIIYFDLNGPDSLASLLSDIEKGNRSLKRIDRDSITIPSWDQSAKELLDKIITISDHTVEGSRT